MTRLELIRQKQRQYGTASRCDVPLRTRFFRGVEGITVDLVDGPANPYRALFVMVTSGWRHFARRGLDQWRESTPATRVEVVRHCLDANTLPNAMEAPKFTFEIRGLSRSAFDQLVRSRIGVIYSSMGGAVSDLSDAAFRISERAFGRDAEARKGALRAAHRAYHEAVSRGESFEAARELLPLSLCWRFTMAINYAALREFCAKRMQAEHQPDAVAVAWLIRDRLLKWDAYPLLGAYLRPHCDRVGHCCFHQPGTDAEFWRGNLNAPCGRNPLRGPCGYSRELAVFAEPNTDFSTLSAQLGIPMPSPAETDPRRFDLTPRDRALFGFESGDGEHGFAEGPSGRHVEAQS